MSKTRNGNQPFDLRALREKLDSSPGRIYWKSLGALAETPEFQDYLAHEFPEGAETFTDPLGRRRFLQLMGASLAFGGLVSCTRQPDEWLVPHVNAPEQVIPGKPLFFASAVECSGFGQGVLVESHDGRPTKLEGNPRHPASLGATSIHAQASILDLYDPDRLQGVFNAGRVRTWEIFEATIGSEMERYRLQQGKGLRILSRTVTSPTLGAQLEQLLSRLPEAQWHQYEPVNRDAALEGTRLAFGEPLNCLYRFDRSAVVLSLDSDFMYWGPAGVRYAKDFSAGRRPGSDRGRMNRLYSVEASPTVSGSVADHRLSVRHSEVVLVAKALAAALGIRVPGASQLDPSVHAFVVAAAADLSANRGRSVVVAGEFQPPEVHALAHVVNEALGNLGTTVLTTEPVESRPEVQVDSLSKLVNDIRAGQVETMLILGGNPAFDGPADLRFAEALEQVPLKAHLTLQRNETSVLCNWNLPESHTLEAWGDLRAYDGTASVVQPLIEPLFGSRSAIELLALLLGEPETRAYDLVRRHWSEAARNDDFENWWRTALHEGVIPGTSAAARDLPVRREVVLEAVNSLENPEAGFEVMIRPDPHLIDGRFANNGWLQEAPKPLTKLTWDNAVIVAPATAERLKLFQEQVVEVRVGETTVRGGLWIQPGHPVNSATLHLGYGRRHVGTVGRDSGFDVYPLRTSSHLWSVPEAEVTATNDTVSLACTQDHSSMEGRPLILEGTLATFRSDPFFARKVANEPSDEAALYPGWEYKDNAWGMSVDLGACIGCNACVVACQAENNIAVVGRDQVRRGREMHWIRVDRYYEGPIDAPAILHQPVMCQHCENAPCESVCPVAATVHSDEGLNDMVYNRCVGTRYCSNNCPYKVRRFNFLLYSDWQTETLKLQRNPNVTVRSRGVMEKCTYCVQRISAARIQSKLEGRDIHDGEINTACQQVCPTNAIVFGNINDPQSQVSRLKKDPRSYGILVELKTKPRTTYLARIRNPNPELEGDGDA